MTKKEPILQQLCISDSGHYLGVAAKSFSVGDGGWGMGDGGWGMGFTDFQVVNYLIFREKVPEFSPRPLQGLALFEGKKV